MGDLPWDSQNSSAPHPLLVLLHGTPCLFGAAAFNGPDIYGSLVSLHSFLRVVAFYPEILHYECAWS